MGLTDNFHSRYDLNTPVGVDFPSRLDPGFSIHIEEPKVLIDWNSLR